MRCAQVVVAPEVAVRRALGRADVWTRTFRAFGFRLTAGATGAQSLTAGQRLVFGADRRWALLRSAHLIVAAVVDGLPVIDIQFARSPACRTSARLHIRMLTASTGAGVLATVDGSVSGRSGSLRRAVLRFEALLLGLATVTAHDPVVVVAGAVLRDGRVLVARRTRPPELAGRWEIPGGQVEPGEGERAALVRELREELGIDIAVGTRIGPAAMVGAGFELRPYLAQWLSGEAAPMEADPAHDRVRWVSVDELAGLDWLPADATFVAAIRAHLQGAG